MDQNTKSIVHSGVLCFRDEFNETMVEKLPSDLKRRILDYLNSAPMGLAGDMRLVDPLTGEWYSSTNVLREKDGFGWNTAIIHMFEQHDIKLNEEFLRLFQANKAS